MKFGKMLGRIVVLCLLYSCLPAGITANKNNAQVCTTSRFDFEEKLLEKMVKVSHEFGMLEKKVHLQSTQMENAINDVSAKLEQFIKDQSTHQKVPAPCPNAWVVFGKSCYFFSDSKITFAASKELCVEKGGKLVHIETEEENCFVQKQLRKTKGDKFWIGITDQEREGRWVFSDTKTAVPYLYWGRSQPNNGRVSNCGAIWEGFGYNWVDEPCTNKFQPVCERELTIA